MLGSTANPSTPVEMRGEVLIRPNTGNLNSSLFINNNGYMGTVALYPNLHNLADLGRSNQRFRTLYVWQVVETSDSRQKENIRTLTNALDIVLGLEAKRYDLKREFAYDPGQITDSRLRERMERDRQDEIGFIAQDVYGILPEMVDYDEDTDIYGLKYTKLIPVLTEAIKELHGQVEEMRNLIRGLQDGDDTPTPKNAPLSSSPSNLVPSQQGFLYQNSPNPFSSTTTIRYSLPESTGSARIYIYNLQGAQVRSYPLTEPGEASLTLSAGELQPGMYIYTLLPMAGSWIVRE